MNRKSNKKFIFITGGVSSSLGKGVAAASIAFLLERRGIKINMLKMDPYINVDPGTMSPFQHGEVFVTDDGAETDLDLGHYERFTSLTLSRKSNFTTGQVYLQVIDNEREGVYLGKTVQVIPHITDEIKRRIHLAAEDSELLISEIGGTVGDIESQPFLEAIRQFAQDVGTENVLFIHLVLLPQLVSAGELKTKPAQHSVRELRSFGLFPNIIICRIEEANINEQIIKKISLFCNIPQSNVFSCPDQSPIYRVPLNFHSQNLDERITEQLGIWASRPNISDLKKTIYNVENPLREVNIGIVGKYTDLKESYKSLEEALNHGALYNQLELKCIYIDAEEFESRDDISEKFKKLQGILIPGGFGERGIDGKLKAIQYARENKIPFFGICLGMQLAIIEFARNVVNIKDANSQEFGEGTDVIHYMKDQSKNISKGGTMRLGSYKCVFKKGSYVHKIYGTNKTNERHRHRLEVNNKFVEDMEKLGLLASGVNPDLDLVEVVELKDHPHYIACQYHPEFKSKPFSPHPLFNSFIIKADNYLN